MRMMQVNLSTADQKFFDRDSKRGIFMCRNTHVSAIIYVQFGAGGAHEDFFPILPGDTLTLDRGDLSQEIYLFSSVANSSNQLAVG